MRWFLRSDPEQQVNLQEEHTATYLSPVLTLFTVKTYVPLTFSIKIGECVVYSMQGVLQIAARKSQRELKVRDGN